MRRAAKIDDNQKEIVDTLRRAGASVCSLAAVGSGCPDLLVGYRNRNILIEVKDGNKSPSRRRLTPDQKTWHACWQGQVAIVENPDEALLVLKYATM